MSETDKQAVIRRDSKMRRAFQCPSGHVIMSASKLIEGRCMVCWPDCDWPDNEPLTIFTELTEDEWNAIPGLDT